MADEVHYIPVLKWRRYAYLALPEFATSPRTRLLPLIEIPPVDVDPGLDSGHKRRLETEIRRIAGQFVRHWGRGRPVLVDAAFLDGSSRGQRGEHPLELLCRYAWDEGVSLVPTSGLARDPDFQRAFLRVASGSPHGLALRVTAEDQVAGACGLPLDELLLGAERTRSDCRTNCDLILDLGALEGCPLPLVTLAGRELVRSMRAAEGWRSVTVLSGGMPADLGVLPPGSHRIERTDWALWQKLALDTDGKTRFGFGDYTVLHPVVGELDGGRPPGVSAQLRYTTDSEWLLLSGSRGGNGTRTGEGCFTVHARDLVSRPEYAGPGLSRGDRIITETAQGVSCGDVQEWLSICLSHHIAFVLRQLGELT